jgi:hypothetical protein
MNCLLSPYVVLCQGIGFPGLFCPSFDNFIVFNVNWLP